MHRSASVAASLVEVHACTNALCWAHRSAFTDGFVHALLCFKVSLASQWTAAIQLRPAQISLCTICEGFGMVDPSRIVERTILVGHPEGLQLLV